MIILRQKEFVSVRDAKKTVDLLYKSSMNRNLSTIGKTQNRMTRQGLLNRGAFSSKPLPANAANRIGGKVQTLRNNTPSLRHEPRDVKSVAKNALQGGGWNRFMDFV